jgi:hypothetical protein
MIALTVATDLLREGKSDGETIVRDHAREYGT